MDTRDSKNLNGTGQFIISERLPATLPFGHWSL